MRIIKLLASGSCLLLVAAAISVVPAARVDGAEPSYPPKLPGGKKLATDTSDAFLKAPSRLRNGVEIAKKAPTVDFMYFPGQTYPGNPWSNWGECLAAGGKCYASIGDHHALPSKDPRYSGNAFVFEYDPKTKALRKLVDLKKLLDLPDGHYTPGKIHGRLDLGEDGWLYFSTHRGSKSATQDDTYHYQGDYIIRTHPGTGKSEVVACGPIPRHCIPTSILDPKRLIFYGGTIGGESYTAPEHFLAYDLKAQKVLYSGPNGPPRYIIFAKSTGRIYYVPTRANQMIGRMMRYDPDKDGPPVQINSTLGLRAATQETPQGYVYTVSSGQGGRATLYAFNTKTEEVEKLGDPSVGTQSYITTIDADPTGRYLYYIPGAHGGSQHDGAAVVQFDVKTRKKKVIAFLHPFYQQEYGYTPLGTFGSAVSEAGDKLYITWNGNRGGADSRGRVSFNTCALTVIHIPESERRP
ncbi:MAG: hypothetical protein IH991_09365 [Planctomycetes bacterium]|nr:hypothetical protein [Planctomycetota bacterium]